MVQIFQRKLSDYIHRQHNIHYVLLGVEKTWNVGKEVNAAIIMFLQHSLSHALNRINKHVSTFNSYCLLHVHFTQMLLGKCYSCVMCPCYVVEHVHVGKNKQV